MRTNVFGLLRAAHAALPLLQRSTAPVIVNVSSRLGSLGVITSPERTNPERLESSYPTLACGSSKTAILALTVHYAEALPRMPIKAVDPSHTATELNVHAGTQTVTEGTNAVVRLDIIGPENPTGGYLDRDATVPW
jgi:NAD(P)-dependent dehydrogenase (short-subunit alcohol dehydrogenase family)